MKLKRLIISEIAGRDSIAAILRHSLDCDIERVIPTYCLTGTDYGDICQLEENVEFLKRKLPITDITQLTKVGNVELWSAINGRFISQIIENYGIYSPCLGCHLYMHLARFPIYFSEGADALISGEREIHGSTIKLSQIPELLEAFVEIAGTVGVNLEMPVRKINSGSEIAEIVGDGWKEGERQMGCLFSKNYYLRDGRPAHLKEATRRYVEGFLIPVGRSLARAIVSGRTDYFRIVEDAICRG